VARKSRLGGWWRDPGWFFVIVGALFGLTFIATVPPLQGPDEHDHFYRSYELAHLRLFPLEHMGDPELDPSVADTMPAGIAELIDPFLIHPDGTLVVGPDVNAKVRAGKVWDYLFRPLNKADQVPVPVNNAATRQRPPVGYVPMAVAVAAGEAVGLSALGIVYLAKLAALAAWLAAGFFAIRWWPFNRWALAALLSLPAFLLQATTMNLDMSQNALGAMLLAAVLRVCYGPRPGVSGELAGSGQVGGQVGWDGLGWGGTVGLTVLASGFVLTKPTAVIFLPVVLLLPAARCPRIWRVSAKWLVLVVPVVLVAAWNRVGGGLTVSNPHVDPSGEGPDQMDYLLGHLPEAIALIPRYIWNQDAGLWSMFGTIAMYTGVMSLAIYATFVAVTAYGTCSDQPQPVLPVRQRLLLGTMALAHFCAVCLALYLGYSPIGARFIDGLQGRYLLIGLVFLLPVWQHLVRVRPAGYARFIRAVPLTILAIAVLSAIARYYETPLAVLAT
jgi:hypothetical protein